MHASSTLAADSRIVRNVLRRMERRGDCLVWTGRLSRDNGYGQVVVYTHHVMYEAFVGPVPDGENVLHTCDTPGCGEPEHLFTGTQAVNMRDMAAKGRAARPSYAGKRRGQYPPGLRAELRGRYAAGDVSYGALAREYGLNRTSVSRLLRGLTYHVDASAGTPARSRPRSTSPRRGRPLDQAPNP